MYVDDALSYTNYLGIEYLKKNVLENYGVVT